MKILQIISSLASGGAEHFVVNLSNQLTDIGHKVVICTMNDGPGLDFNKQFLNSNIEYYSLQIKGMGIVAILRKTFHLITSCRPDVVHCHLAVLQYIFPVCFLRSLKIYHTIHSIPKYASGGQWWHKFLFKILYGTGLVTPITVAKECHAVYKTYYGLKNDVLIENGIAPIKPTGNIDKIKMEVSNYKQDDNTAVFIHVARFHEAKNQKMLVDAFNELHNKSINFVLLVIGRGFDIGKGEILKNSACSKIHFLGEKNNVSDYLLCSDYFCLTSVYEGLPISLIEAMSVGLTSISTAVGGIKNAIEDGISGYLCKEITKDAYIETILRAMKNKLDKKQVIKHYEGKFSIKQCANKYIELYTQ